jgi:hypothetical protein
MSVKEPVPLLLRWDLIAESRADGRLSHQVEEPSVAK